MNAFRIIFALAVILVVGNPAAAQNLITNGDFDQGNLNGWLTATINGCAGTSTVGILSSDSPNVQVLQVRKVNAGGCFGSASIEQNLSIPVTASAPLELRADVKALNASVVGGCGNGLEYPLAIQLGYVPPGGTQKQLRFGFHLGGSSCGIATTDGPDTVVVQRQLSPDEWTPFNSGDLLNWIPAGSTINRIIVFGLGWDFTGRADNIVLAQQSCSGSWTGRQDMPTARYQVQLAHVNGRIYAIGGDLGVFPQDSDHNEEYNPLTNSWLPKRPLSFGRRAHTVVELGGKIYVIGGVSNNTGVVPLPTVEVYDPATNAPWQAVEDMPAGRQHPAAAVIGGKIYVFAANSPGGVNDTRTLVYDSQTGHWTTLSATSPIRHIWTATTIGNLIYVTGTDAACPQTILDTGACIASSSRNLFYAYDPATDTFLQRQGMNIPRAFPAAATVGGRLYLVGGNRDINSGPPLETGETEEYDPATNMWTMKATMLTARYNLSAVAAFGKIHVIGGGASNNQVFKTNEEFDPYAGTCTAAGAGTITVLARALDGNPIAGATVQVLFGPTQITSATGDASFSLAEGVYDFSVTAAGYQSADFSAGIRNGQAKSIDVTLVHNGVGQTSVVVVPAISSWVDAVTVGPGGRVIAYASGRWTGDPNQPFNGPDGQLSGNQCGPNCPIPTEVHSSLVGRSDPLNPFAVGSTLDASFGNVATLQLSINDTQGIFGDNSGSVSVTVIAIPPGGGAGQSDILLAGVQQLSQAVIEGEAAVFRLYLQNVGTAPFQGAKAWVQFLPEDTQAPFSNYGWPICDQNSNLWNICSVRLEIDVPALAANQTGYVDVTVTFYANTAGFDAFGQTAPRLKVTLLPVSGDSNSQNNYAELDPFKIEINALKDVVNCGFAVATVIVNHPSFAAAVPRVNLLNKVLLTSDDIGKLIDYAGIMQTAFAFFDAEINGDSTAAADALRSLNLQIAATIGEIPEAIAVDYLATIWEGGVSCANLGLVFFDGWFDAWRQLGYNFSGALLGSPANMTGFDGPGNMTGFTASGPVRQIPISALTDRGKGQLIVAATRIEKLRLVGTGNGTYDLNVVNSFDQLKVAVDEFPIVAGMVIEFDFDWPMLVAKGDGVTIRIDQNGDGFFEGSFQSGLVVGDTTGPMVTAPGAITIPATEAGGARGANSTALAAFLAGGSATDLVDPNPMRLAAQVNGLDADNSTLFPLGTSTVTFRFRDASGNIGMATSTVTVQLGTTRISGTIAGKGRDASGTFYVDLRLTNTGTGHARNVKINTLAFRTLSGAGTVTYNSGLSGALPLMIGNLDAGGATILRLYLNVPSTVTRFSITENGSLQNVAGASSNFSAAQSVFP